MFTKSGGVKDITIADGTDLTADQSFTKTWRLYNAGTCTWKSNYEIYFTSGNGMSAPAHVDLNDTVAPGEYTDVSIKMIAPHDTGSYAGYWLMRSGNGVSFGWGGMPTALSGSRSMWSGRRLPITPTPGRFSSANTAKLSGAPRLGKFPALARTRIYQWLDPAP